MGDLNQKLLEEDDDLESLRLAALQSLKKKSNEIGTTTPFENLTKFNATSRGKQKRTKYARLSSRNGRNGQFNGWKSRNTNLIAVPMVGEDKLQDCEKSSESSPKLILPQDRYCKTEKTNIKIDGTTSKFDRYNNSDASESEDSEEDTEEVHTNDNKSELKRSNSLEALMEELENEIQGVKQREDKGKAKCKKKSMRSVEIEVIKDINHDVNEKVNTTVLKENLLPEIKNEPLNNVKKPANDFNRHRKWQNRHRNQQNHGNSAFISNTPSLISLPSAILNYPGAPLPLVPTFPIYNQPIPLNFDNSVYVAPPPVLFEPPLSSAHIVAPNIYERPRSPLIVNTETFATNTMAPLSPRSAAFVLENRAIIEKRKRRSYSRSPSPTRFRRSRSRSPKRSLTPKILKKRSLSPIQNLKTLPMKNSPSKKVTSVYDRLGGLKTSHKLETIQPKQEKVSEPIQTIDPILEARRKKFEQKEITVKEGIIRLKPSKDEDVTKMDDMTTTNNDKNPLDEIDEDALLEGEDSFLVENQADSILFSDEESNSDNEGRFKSKLENTDKVPVLSFRKLMNGAKTNVVNESNVINKSSKRSNKKRSNSPLQQKNLSAKHQKIISPPVKKKHSIVLPVDNKKIEIKLRNPAKYRKTESGNGNDENGRKIVEIFSDEFVESSESDGRNINEAPENLNEGDLRAQLSRKRAERQKHPVIEGGIPSRLLQNALQEVGVKKEKKRKNTDENIEGKLPIHWRLGTSSNSLDLFGKKSRKQKKKGSQEQV